MYDVIVLLTKEPCHSRVSSLKLSDIFSVKKKQHTHLSHWLKWILSLIQRVYLMLLWQLRAELWLSTGYSVLPTYTLSHDFDLDWHLHQVTRNKSISSFWHYLRPLKMLTLLPEQEKCTPPCPDCTRPPPNEGSLGKTSCQAMGGETQCAGDILCKLAWLLSNKLAHSQTHILKIGRSWKIYCIWWLIIFTLDEWVLNECLLFLFADASSINTSEPLPLTVIQCMWHMMCKLWILSFFSFPVIFDSKLLSLLVMSGVERSSSNPFMHQS